MPNSVDQFRGICDNDKFGSSGSYHFFLQQSPTSAFDRVEPGGNFIRPIHSDINSSILLCGRFEGIDQRVLDARAVQEISIGDYVLSGGELAAQVLIDACVRLLPGVAGNETSLAEESFASGLLEYPHYTRPREWEGHAIPEVLLSGDHRKIADWRREQAEKLTRERRPDLWQRRRLKRPPQVES